ncbi:MAG: DUF3231 family protein [Candidatus Saccharibacteria bacterium]
MDFMKAVFNREPQGNELHAGDVLSLWDVARNKLIGLSTLSVYYRQAKDPDMKDLLKNGLDFIVDRHIDKIQKLLDKKGYNFPKGENWRRDLNEDAPFVIPNTLLDDQTIAMSLREIIRLTLSLESEGLRNSTDTDVRDLLSSIMDEDNTAYSGILALQRKKNWTDFPPTIFSH